MESTFLLIFFFIFLLFLFPLPIHLLLILQIFFSCSPVLPLNPSILFSCFPVLPTANTVLLFSLPQIMFSCSPVHPTADTVLLFSYSRVLLFSCFPYCRYCSSVLLFSCSPVHPTAGTVLLFSCSRVLLFSLLQILSKFDRKETLSLYSANKVFILSLVFSKNNKCRDKKRKLFRTCDNFILYYLYLYHTTQPYGRKDGYTLYNIYIYICICRQYRVTHKR